MNSALNKGKVIAVCTSGKKGTQKTEGPSIRLVPGCGIEGDAHAGNWHRQVSLLDLAKIEAAPENPSAAPKSVSEKNVSELVEGSETFFYPLY